MIPRQNVHFWWWNRAHKAERESTINIYLAPLLFLYVLPSLFLFTSVYNGISLYFHNIAVHDCGRCLCLCVFVSVYFCHDTRAMCLCYAVDITMMSIFTCCTNWVREREQAPTAISTNGDVPMWNVVYIRNLLPVHKSLPENITKTTTTTIAVAVFAVAQNNSAHRTEGNLE